MTTLTGNCYFRSKTRNGTGEFVDLVSEVPDRSVLKVVVVKSASDDKPGPSHAVMHVCAFIICRGGLLNSNATA